MGYPTSQLHLVSEQDGCGNRRETLEGTILSWTLKTKSQVSQAAMPYYYLREAPFHSVPQTNTQNVQSMLCFSYFLRLGMRNQPRDSTTPATAYCRISPVIGEWRKGGQTTN
mmetsp:Transcript_51818/g.135171  ORF Transcript_51818/g.135171 Transcript_51818/m.135171 type:complete len:112 (+) Transcript_51818:272-607(+)